MNNTNMSQDGNAKKQKTKEEIKREKMLNRSLTTLPSVVQNSLGIVAIQKDDNVFYLGNNKFLKIYSIKAASLGSKKKQFIDAIAGNTLNRIRISCFSKIKDQKMSAYSFLSVYFECDCYAAAFDAIKEFEEILNSSSFKKLNIPVNGCSIDTALMFMHMNSAGKMKQVEYNSMLSAKKNLKTDIFSLVKEQQNGEFISHDKCGICFVGEYFCEDPFEINDILIGLEGNVQIVVDMQKFSSEEWEIFNYQLGEKYNVSSELNENEEILNLTFLLSVLVDSPADIPEIKDMIIERFGQKNILLVPCSGREKDVFNSICSIGTIDFHSMKNASVDFASSLIL